MTQIIVAPVVKRSDGFDHVKIYQSLLKEELWIKKVKIQF